MKPRLMCAVLVIAVAIGMPVAVFAAARQTGEGTFTVDQQAYQWGTAPSSTSNTTWQTVNIRGGDDAQQSLLVFTTGPISATLSVDVKGAPVEFRLFDTSRVMRPGKAEFAPGPGDTSRSFTFVRAGDPSEGTGCRNLVLQWRSPSGKKVVLERAMLIATSQVSGTGGCA